MNQHVPHYSWPKEGPIRIPSWVYTDETIFQRELETFHFGKSWNYVGMECEIPEPGSYKRTHIGPRSFLMTRDENGEVHVVENRCAHRDSQLTWKECGKFESNMVICPYHNWTYAMNGDLKSMPFYRGAKGMPGMPKSFDMKEHGLRKLRVARRGGVVWATYSDETPDFAEFVGPDILKWYDRVFNGRKLKLLGFARQIVPCNWKFYTDNTHDGYHAALLHTFIPKFGLWRPDGDYHQVPTEHGRHVLYHMRYAEKLDKENEVTKQLRVMQSDFSLKDPRVVTPFRDEYGDSTNTAYQIFPTVVIQQFLSSLSIRNIIPKTATTHELTWNYFGYDDDDEEMIRARQRHTNLVGPSGYVSAEDTEIIAQLQTVVDKTSTEHVIEMGGHGIEAAHTMISESAIRAFYDFYRREMRL